MAVKHKTHATDLGNRPQRVTTLRLRWEGDESERRFLWPLHGATLVPRSTAWAHRGVPRALPRRCAYTAVRVGRESGLARLAAVLPAITGMTAGLDDVASRGELAAALRFELVRFEPRRGGAATVRVKVHQVLAARVDVCVIITPAVHTAVG